MENFLIILGIAVVPPILTLLTSCIVNFTLNPFKYFYEDWKSKYIQFSLLIYTIFTLVGAGLFYKIKEEKLHSIKTKWDEDNGCYNVFVCGPEVNGINIFIKSKQNLK